MSLQLPKCNTTLVYSVLRDNKGIYQSVSDIKLQLFENYQVSMNLSTIALHIQHLRYVLGSNLLCKVERRGKKRVIAQCYTINPTYTP